MQQGFDVLEKFKYFNEYLKNKDYLRLSDEIRRTNPVDIKDYMQTLDLSQAVIVFRLLTKDDAAEVFAELDREDQQRLLEGFSDIEVSTVVNELYFDDMIDMLEEMPATLVKRILKNSDADERRRINMFLKFPEDSAGSIMTTEYIELKPDMTVKEALKIIKETGMDKVTVYTCYVTNETKVLLGYVSLRVMVTSDVDIKIKDLMYEDVIMVNTHDDQEDVAAIFRKYGFTALPVVDNELRLTGIITVDDIMEVMEMEATEDFHKMAALNPEEDSYMDTSVLHLAKNRIPWLLFLMISAAFSSTIIQSHQMVIQSVIALNMFIPMITDSGGNAGSQASTLVIRGMATGDIKLTDWIKVLLKELKVSLLVGSVMCFVAFLKCILFDNVEILVAITVAFTIFFTIMLSKMIGSMLPILAKKLKFDPAIMASPLITTMVDSAALIVYFKVATLILGI
ncbi:MAG: magnesium transporter [Tissierellia bacterium]|nr:magnesium transporter [Tissierellia bacterium]